MRRTWRCRLNGGRSAGPSLRRLAATGDFGGAFRAVRAARAGRYVPPRAAAGCTCQPGAWWTITALVAAWLALAGGPLASATNVRLKDGRVLKGAVAKVESLVIEPTRLFDAKSPSDEQAPVPRLIVVVDDNLRRYFVPWGQVQGLDEGDAGEVYEKFRLKQRVARNGFAVAAVGAFSHVDPWDEFGRRTVKMSTQRGEQAIIQGITEVTPLWTRVQSLFAAGQAIVWDQRIATATIPRDKLNQMLSKQIEPTNLDQRLRLVRFYLQAKRFKDARDELEEVIRDFPDREAQFSNVVRDLTQTQARELVAEIRFRQEAGQHRLAYSMLEHFPTEGIAGETLQTVRRMLDEYQKEYEHYQSVLRTFDELLAKINDTRLREKIAPVREEIMTELNINTLSRMAAYLQFVDDEELPPEDRLALAISGWLVGTNDATRKLPLALSLYEVRNLVRSYLLADRNKADRTQILEALRGQEGATPEMVARVLAHLRPPVPPPAERDGEPGLYELTAPGAPGQADVTYYVQVPHEYDDHRRYPCIVTLHAGFSTAREQIDWWAGERMEDGTRRGQAYRQGYIVLAPAWGELHQKAYGFSAAEVAAVLNSLRHACRRFAIDTDRVFLTGHSMGADAAWDIGLAHPDLWAGVIPIAAASDKFIARYWHNARYLPWYFVCGELDGDKHVRNARDFDRYLQRAFDVTVCEFQGRGHEFFPDELLPLFDWMARKQRNFYPRDFVCRSMRPWDNFFWWAELEEMPASTMVDPESWPPPRGTKESQIKGSINNGNGIMLTASAARAILWLSPQVVDFGQHISITFNGKRQRAIEEAIRPDIGVMLEDARTRADRQHPFWAKVEVPTGRVNNVALRGRARQNR